LAPSRRVIVLHPFRQGGGAQGGVAVPPPLSLYIHFPWCVRKCPYCDFNSHEVRGGYPESDYINALIADLERALPQVWGRRVSSVFIGGGTPSLMAPASVDSLLTAVRSRLSLAPDAEITLEANPGTVDAAHFAGYRAAGVNRISIAVQSFNARHLAALGRIHDEREARAAIELALQHFDNVNLDVMYALPQQNLQQARADIDAAAAYGTAHLSAYQLTIEPNTQFHHAPPPLPDPDLAADMQDMVEQTLVGHGYRHYETSAFARCGRECRHNLNYWLFGDYLGIGAGAHGKLSFHDRIVRDTRHKHPQAYLDAMCGGAPLPVSREVPAAQLPFEFMMNALRLADGFQPRLFGERTGLPLEAIRRELDHAQARGLLKVTPEKIVPTEHGRRFLNDLLQLFLPNAS
jgi:putative oxygen-independent coproporphyrinogen III oxidase